MSGGLDALGTREAADLVVEAAGRGLHAVWVNEEHLDQADRSAATSSTLAFLGHVGARTTSLRLGTSVLLLPLHHPLRLAEETASLAVLTGGRLDLGVSAGGNGRYAAAFGTDPAHRRADFDRTLAALRTLWAGGTVDVATSTHRGTGASLPLRPDPPPDLYWGAHSPESVRRAAAAGEPLVQHLLGPPDLLAAARAVYRDAHPDPAALLARSPVSRFAHLAATDRLARARALPAARALTARLRGIGIQHRPEITRPDALEPERFLAETAVVGSPATVVRALTDLAGQLGTTRLNLNLGWFGTVPAPQLRDALRLLVDEVIPALRRGPDAQPRCPTNQSRAATDECAKPST